MEEIKNRESPIITQSLLIVNNMDYEYLFELFKLTFSARLTIWWHHSYITKIGDI